MVDTNAIRKIMIDKGNMPVSALALKLRKSPATVGRWLDTGIMPTIFAEAIADELEIPQASRTVIFLTVCFLGSYIRMTEGSLATPPPTPTSPGPARSIGKPRKEVKGVEVTIKGDAKEIAALVLAIQERQQGDIYGQYRLIGVDYGTRGGAGGKG